MKYIAFISDIKNDNGTVLKNILRICQPAIECKTKKEIDVLIKRDLPSDAKNITVIDSKELPKDRYFRDAWKLEKEKISVDETKVIDVKIKKLGASQFKKLKEIKDETEDAFLEQDTTKLAIINLKKKTVKNFAVDTRKHLKTLKSLEDIKSYIPECLQ